MQSLYRETKEEEGRSRVVVTPTVEARSPQTATRLSNLSKQRPDPGVANTARPMAIAVSG